MHATNRHTRNAFTLVELLVVIAIISVLAALLLPALEKSLMHARLVSCQSQLRQMTMTFNTYLNDHDERFPMVLWNGNSPTNKLFPFGLAANTHAILYGLHYVEDHHLLYCPDGEEPTGTRADRIKRFQLLYDIQYQELACDYVLGWMMTLDGTQTFPPTANIAMTRDRYLRTRSIWIADGVNNWTGLTYNLTAHDNWRLQNVARLDGSAAVIPEFQLQLVALGETAITNRTNILCGFPWWTHCETMAEKK